MYSIVFLSYFYIISFGQNSPSAKELLKDLGCATCHNGIPVESDIVEIAPDLTQSGIRYHPEYIFNYLLYPIKIRQNIGLARMPNFYLSQREALALTLYSLELIPENIERPDFPFSKSYEKIKASFPEVDAQIGEKIFYALNCVACHKQSSVVLWEKKMGPDLSFEGARIKRDWLISYVQQPESIRPFGFYAGSGSRMPNFLLIDSEVDTLTAYLLRRKEKFSSDSLLFEPKELSAFSKAKALKLLKEKLSCLGCHQLGGEGGRIGPDLSSLSSRLQDEYSYRIIKDPKSLIPEAVMPRIETTAGTLDSVVNYLIKQDLLRNESSYLSLVDNHPYFHQGLEKSESLYMKFCVACHGLNGQGDGYNAKFLPVAPTKHADAAYMSTRPDDTLFDGIFAGGYILNKSHLMPPWGFVLEYDDIRLLVSYIRKLCQCVSPEWSRDDLQKFRNQSD